MNVDSITLNSLVLYIPIRLVVLCPLGETGENKNKCQVPGSWELGSGGAENTALWEWGWEHRSSAGGARMETGSLVS